MISSLEITLKNESQLLSSSDDDMSVGSSTDETQSNAHINDERKPVTILDWRDDSGISDNLYIQSDRASGCTHARCSGSKVSHVLSPILTTDHDDPMFR